MKEADDHSNDLCPVSRYRSRGLLLLAAPRVLADTIAAAVNSACIPETI